MDKFPDGTHVRLRSRVRRASYLHSDEDGVGVSLRPLGREPTLNAVWRVHRVLRDGIDYVLLHGAAYGRYLALSPGEEEPAGPDRGVPAIQRGYDARDLDAVMWRPIAVAGANSGGYVRMRHVYNGNLRANGRFRPWNTRVTVEHDEALERRGRPTQTGAAASPSTSDWGEFDSCPFFLLGTRALIGIGAEHDSWNGLLLLARKTNPGRFVFSRFSQELLNLMFAFVLAEVCACCY